MNSPDSPASAAAGRHVSVVMLDADAPVLREGAHGVLGRQVARVQVVGDVGRLEVEQPLQMRQVSSRRLDTSAGLRGRPCAGHVRAPAARQRERVLQLGADRQNGLRVPIRSASGSGA